MGIKALGDVVNIFLLFISWLLLQKFFFNHVRLIIGALDWNSDKTDPKQIDTWICHNKAPTLITDTKVQFNTKHLEYSNYISVYGIPIEFPPVYHVGCPMLYILILWGMDIFFFGEGRGSNGQPLMIKCKDLSVNK